MGVPKFFRYISERYPCLSELVRDYQIPDFDNLYLDMNGIIHTCSHPNDGDAHFRITEEKIFQDIFHYIEVLFRMIKPKKLFFMAVDGVAPRAKMNQQRGRRFRSAKEAEKLETEAVARGEQLPTEARFDSNCITPGTVFMARLHEQLKYFVINKISTDKLWQGCRIILSGHETPGEGEHKIMDYIRYMRAQPNYDPNTRHCLYGLDADLLMLGMCTHEPHFCLLREEVKFGKKSTKRKCVPEEISFYLLHLSLMREYLDLEFASLKQTLPFDYDIEKIIDDWVLMGFLVGNDFIPHLPNMHIANGALPILYEAYIKILPSLGGYINENGTLNLERFEKYLESLRSIDINNFSEHYADLKFFEAKTGRRPNDKERTSYKPKQLETFEFDEKVNEVELEPEKTTTDSGLAALIKATDDMFLGPEKNKSKPVEPSEANLSNLEEEFEGDFDYESDQSTDDDLFNEEFRLHKQDYYMNKLEYSQVTPEVLKSQAEGYVRAIQWNLNYYYNGVCSWSWYYPHHYAPYLSDIKGFGDLKLDFELGKPFKPYEQLLAVLPAASKSLLPECYQELMTSESSPLKHYYPTDFKTDLNGKRQDWEALVLIPFIDEDVLLNAMDPLSKKLSLEEIKRNTHRPMLVYSYTKEDLGVYEAPQYFPTTKENHAECKALSIDDIRIPIEKLVKGRYPGAQKDVFYPGFPTFRHLKYTGTLEKAKVKVFEQPSRSDNMIVNVIPKPLLSEDALARQILGNTVFIGWPHLREALAVSITTPNYKYNYVEGYPGQYNLEDIRDSRTLSYEANGIILHYKNRLGINVGETKAVVHAKPMVGRKCVYTSQGEVTFEKQWATTPSNYPYQIIIYGIKYHEEAISKFSNIQSLFPIDSECFLLTHPMYGSLGKIMDSKETLPKGRLKLSVKVQEEPNLAGITELEQKMSMEYMPLSAAASRLSISRNVFSRITGTIYLLSKNDMPSESTYKTNIGLNLKFNVKNQEIPGYTKRLGNVWVYSQKAIDLVQSYILFCPELFEFLNMSDKNDDIFKEDLFSENCDERVKDLKEWLKQQPYQSIERLTCGSEVMDPENVKKLEALIDAFNENLSKQPKSKNTVMQVKPYLLYKPGLQTGNIMPDPSTKFRLCDRVVNVRESYTVPLGLKGTLIAIHKSTTGSDADVIYDVLFDGPFVGGLTLNCSPNRAYRLPPTAMINVSHGSRMYKKLTGEPGQLLQTLKAANNLNYRNQPQNSAFAAFMDVNRGVPSDYSNNYRPHVYQNKPQPTLAVFGAYPQQFVGPYQHKAYNNKGFAQTSGNTINKGSVNLPGSIKAHNNFMPNFLNSAVNMSNMSTKQIPSLQKIENKIPNKESPRKEPLEPIKVTDTEILKKVLKINDKTDKVPPKVIRDNTKKQIKVIKSVHSIEQKLLKKECVSVPINVPAPPTSWVRSTVPQQKMQTQSDHKEKLTAKSSIEKVTKSESLQDVHSKTVFVPLQAARAHLKNQNSTNCDVKKSDRSPKKYEPNQPGSSQDLTHSPKKEKNSDSFQNKEKKQRKVRMAANFSVKMSIPP